MDNLRLNLLHLVAFVLLLQMSFYALATESIKVNKILDLNIDSSINPAIFEYMQKAYAKAHTENFQVVLINMNTPGGLVSTTKEIIKLIGESDLPTIIWITPEGSSATSAGAIIASSSHFLFMSRGTHIGAATPVQMGKDIESKDLRQKSINDLVAKVKSLSKARGRNPKPFEEMISNAKSYGAQEARELKIIDRIVDSKDELISHLSDHSVLIKGRTKNLIVDANNPPTIISYKMTLGNRMLNTFADPGLTYILFIIGAALIYFELQAPGGFIAGALGATFLVLAAIGFQVLPLNYGAFALIGLSFIFFVLEVYITSFGLLSLLGLAALISGSLFLFDTQDSFIGMSQEVIFSVVFGIVAIMGVIVSVFFKGKTLENPDTQSLIGRQGIIIEELSTAGEFLYRIKVDGEIWKAKADQLFKINDKVVVNGEDQSDLYLNIININNSKKGT